MYGEESRRLVEPEMKEYMGRRKLENEAHESHPAAGHPSSVSVLTVNTNHDVDDTSKEVAHTEVSIVPP